MIHFDVGTRETDFVYNAQGFLKSVTDPENHTTFYTYDAVGRVTRINRPDSASVEFTYDNNGNMMVLPRTFNGYGEVDAQSFTLGGQGLTSWTLISDDNGRIIQKTDTVDGLTSDYAYTCDPMGRLLTVTKDGVLVEEYQCNPNGTGTRTYEYPQRY